MISKELLTQFIERNGIKEINEISSKVTVSEKQINFLMSLYRKEKEIRKEGECHFGAVIGVIKINNIAHYVQLYQAKWGKPAYVLLEKDWQ